jgi:hypothetical protein
MPIAFNTVSRRRVFFPVYHAQIKNFNPFLLSLRLKAYPQQKTVRCFYKKQTGLMP